MLHSKGNEQRSSVPSVLESLHLPLQAHPHLSPPSSQRLTCTGHTKEGLHCPLASVTSRRREGGRGVGGDILQAPSLQRLQLSLQLSPASTPRVTTTPHCPQPPPGPTPAHTLQIISLVNSQVATCLLPAPRGDAFSHLYVTPLSGRQISSSPRPCQAPPTDTAPAQASTRHIPKTKGLSSQLRLIGSPCVTDRRRSRPSPPLRRASCFSLPLDARHQGPQEATLLFALVPSQPLLTTHLCPHPRRGLLLVPHPGG